MDDGRLIGSAERRGVSRCCRLVVPCCVGVFVAGCTCVFVWSSVVLAASCGVAALVAQLLASVVVLVLATLALTSLARVALTHPGNPPPNWLALPAYASRPRQEDEEAPLRADRVIRYCKHCCDFKPDRTHHCSVLGECVLRFDHFCPWVGNTVGFYNHKFFLLFCFYTGLLGSFALLCAVVSLLWRTLFDFRLWATLDVVLGVLGFVGFLFGLTLVSFFVMHVQLIRRNQTTLEDMKNDRRWDLGSAKENWRELMGSQVLWFLPLPASDVGDGVVFGMNF